MGARIRASRRIAITTHGTAADDSDGIGRAGGRRLGRRRVVFGIAVIVAGLVIVAALHYLPAVESLRAVRSSAAGLAADLRGLGPGDVDRATVEGLRARIDTLDRQLQPGRDLLTGDLIVGLARSMPVTRDQVVGADDLVAAADRVIEASRIGLDLGDRFVASRESGSNGKAMLGDIVQLMATSQERVDRIGQLLDQAHTRLDQIPPGAAGVILDAREQIAGPLARYAPLLRDYAKVDSWLPAALGWGGERRYLVLAQNPAELRPTGGFTGTIGVLTMRDGSLADMTFEDVYVLDGKPGMPYQQPPDALSAHLLGRASWELADANWSPDFPSAAAQALQLYTLESGDDAIDGVIGITTFALDRLLEVIGPVAVPGYDVTVAAGEVTVAGISKTRDDSLGTQRKRFLGVLADAVLQRTFATDPARWGALLTAFETIGRERLVQAWFPDPAVEAQIAGSTWAGAVRQDPGDYLYAVDANVAPSSKLSLVVQRSSRLEVDLAADDSAHHRLRLDWRNDADHPGEPYQTLRAASEGANGAYGVYTRVLVPDGSELIEAIGESALPVSGVESEDVEAGRLAWGNYLLIPPGTAWLADEWTTPGAVLTDGHERVYRLTIQKQPGQGPEPTAVVIHVPSESRITSASPGMQVTGDTATWDGTLNDDVVLEVRYQP